MGLWLLDQQRAGLPVNRLQSQMGHLSGPESVMGHQMQHHEVAPTAPAGSVNRGEKLLDHRPVKRPGWQLIAKPDRLVNKVEPHRDQMTFKTVKEENSQIAHGREQ